MDDVEQRIEKLGLKLPIASVPAANNVPFKVNGKTLILSGVICILDGNMTHVGQVGAGQTVESGYAGARVCALNTLASAKLALGSLERVSEILFVSGYVNAVAGFDKSPQVINGASDLFVEIFGERGKHARAAVAVAGLPRNSTVEIQVTLLFE
jgi:enamine deaminase RidA (YjgF/YER057c/UK114 family)